ncbi:helix-turn-helix domain-containing protein [Nonomuraea sp. NPDC052116]|uniref:helix-turn-helix domain-containing protein n=1 Tax=Nonomuraea sp. NPDC052116 TaxID=3155665 RepID=UPI003432399A
MRDVLYLEEIEQAEALLKPQRVEVLRQLAEPRTCSEVAERLGQTPQRVYYHVKRLVEAGLVDLVSERKVRGIHEGIYQAGARSYWLSPRLVGRIGLRKARDELSLGYLLDLMEEVQSDIAALDRSAPELPSIGLSGEIRVRPEERQEFLNDLQTMLQGLFTRYGGAEGDAFKLAVACYPNAAPDPPATADPPAASGPPAPSTPPAPAGPSSTDASPAPTDETGPHRRPGGGNRPQPA